MIEITYHTHHFLKNISRCFFFDNAWLGGFFLALLLVFNPLLFLFGLTAALIGYVSALFVSTPKILRDCGLITINGLFFGVSLANMFDKTPAFFFCFLLGAFTLPLLTKATYQVLQHWKLNPLILPYILMIWTLTLIAERGTSGLHIAWWQEASLIPLFPTPTEGYLQFLASLGKTTAELFFVPHPYFGFCLLILITSFAPRRGLFFILGNVLALTVAALMSKGPITFTEGSFSYSTGLVGLGLASLPEKINWKSILLFCVLSAVFSLALDQFFAIEQLPSLTLPFVLTFWTAILCQAPRVNISWAPSTQGVPQLSILKGMHPTKSSSATVVAGA